MRGRWVALALRPTLLLVAAYVIDLSLYELAHALTAVWLGIPATLFHNYVSADTTHGSPRAAALVAAGGPLFSLLFGVGCWLARRGTRGSWAELPLLYLAVFGIALALGSVATIAFAGDLDAAAAALGWPHAARTSVAVVGGLLLCSFAYDVGRELRELAPADLGAVRAMIVMALVPAVAGTLVLLAAYQPLSRTEAITRLGEAGFWIVAALGALIGSARPARSSRLDARPADWALALAAIAAVRVLAIGLPFGSAAAPLPPSSAAAAPRAAPSAAVAPPRSPSAAIPPKSPSTATPPKSPGSQVPPH